jgi:two-component sensor histidine kinase
VPFHGRRDTSGAICLYSRAQRAFTAETIDLLAGFAGEAALALENARLYEEAQRSLAAKSALLAEMHHRVKNNLQTVASLLRLGLRHTKSPEVATVLQESQARIQSIAAVHDLLSQEDVGLTTVAQVVQKIVGIAEVHFRDPRQRIHFEISGETMPVPTQQATTLAIVLNELLSNAMRHAFAGRATGSIRIWYGSEAGRVLVRVSDDGRGLPASFNLDTGKGLGLSIVETLTRHDLRGDLKVFADGETTFEISFPQ